MARFVALLLAIATAIGSSSAALPKLNQYRNSWDCDHDNAILYHAAPVSGRCYDLDDATGAYFLHTSGFWNCRPYKKKGCSDDEFPWNISFKAWEGKCRSKGVTRSIKCS